ncbi:MAG TPA: substrate-binding domain-containing protein, partial [Luteibacter sp.]|nr:substrate-binding domain-containing protein [Luteibacter sp.]
LAGKNKKVLVVGFDGTPDGKTAVQNGSMAATVAQQPEEIGKLGVETAKKLIDKQPVEKSIAVPLKLLTKE